MSDLIHAELVQRGLPNLSVKAATGLRNLKTALVIALAKKYPAWYDDYQQSHAGVCRRRIDALQQIAADPRLAQRDDIKGLADYLKGPALIVAELGSRQNHSITATSSAGLKNMWDSMTHAMIERNLVFGALYHRWLENDPLEQEPTEQAQPAAA